ncbi:MAG TPA: HAMP domain-containing sensor histidine kinase [Nocardioidaceae bacterium]
MRVAATFALITLLVTVALSAATYTLTRAYLLRNREDLATRQAFLDGNVASGTLIDRASEPKDLVTSLGGDPGTQVLIHLDGEWYSSSVAIDPASLPSSLTAAVASGNAARQRFSVAGVPHLAIGTPLAAAGAEYFEVVPLRELQRTLRTLLTYLVLASAVTTAVGAAAGWWSSQRLLAPFRRISDVAVDVAKGSLDKRLDDDGDSDLSPLTTSFNEMVNALQDRIAVEAQFAGDVSHELRTPLTALRTATAVVANDVDALPPRVRPAVDVLTNQVDYFERLVLDLLEISRMDAGVDSLQLETVDVREVVVAAAKSAGGGPVEIVGSGPFEIDTDKRRLGRVVVNLIENANRHGGGVTNVSVTRSDGHILVAVEDHGAGIASQDLDHVFDRFWRAPNRDPGVRGTGLGLALVREHVKLMRGSIRLGPNEGAGTKAVIELPVDES